MSRVEDDRQAARLAERQVEARRNEEAQRGKKAADASTFKKLVGQTQQASQQEQARASAHVKDPHGQENIGKSAIALLLESSEAQQAEAAKGQTQSESAFKSRLGTKSFGENVKQATRQEGQQGAQVRQGDQQTGAQQLKQAGADKANTSQVSEH
ncbi:MAG: hypothetical protein INH37_09150, partial [Myxococcaceae bacterium]|nr:hypothetical protein [Myxococcaceae bacterium]